MTKLEDTIYVSSIIGAFIVVMLTEQGQIRDLVGLPNNRISIYGLYFLLFLIFCNIWAWTRSKISGLKGVQTKQSTVKDKQLQHEDHLKFALIITVGLIFAHQKNPTLCSTQRMTIILVWLLVSRILKALGDYLNSVMTSIKVWNTLGDSMSFIACVITIGLAFEVDMFLFL